MLKKSFNRLSTQSQKYSSSSNWLSSSPSFAMALSAEKGASLPGRIEYSHSNSGPINLSPVLCLATAQTSQKRWLISLGLNYRLSAYLLNNIYALEWSPPKGWNILSPSTTAENAWRFSMSYFRPKVCWRMTLTGVGLRGKTFTDQKRSCPQISPEHQTNLD